MFSSLSEADTKWWLILWRLPNVGPAAFRVLYESYKENPQAIFTEKEKTLLQLGVHPKTIAALHDVFSNRSHSVYQQVENDIAWLAQDNHHLVHYQSALYPPMLQEITGAPALLFVNGNVGSLLNPQIAIVGSRNASMLGREIAHDFAKHLSKMGLTITSGLALGIDTLSHEGALAGGGQTVAVLGTGVDVLYPAQNKKLAHRIIDEGGALVSEAPLGTPALPSLFPRRNRIISGLSLGVVVVEAAVKSGSLITARLASEQGREVFAIPGSIHDAMHKGCHQLIREGATLTETADDILSALSSLARFQANALQTTKEKTTRSNKSANSEKLANINPKAKTVLQNLGFEPTPIDTVIERCNLQPAEASGLLLALELDGWVVAEAGGYMKTIKAKEFV